MINSVEQYLTQLKKALSGSDRAIVQDALFDAEEYLRTALGNTPSGMTEGEMLAAVIEKYGAPEEIAAAYRQIESLTPPPLVAREHAGPQTAPSLPAAKDTRPFYARFFGVFVEPRTWGSLFYLLFALVTGIIYFTWAVIGISLSAGLMVLIIGLPFAGLFLLSVRGIGLIEGYIVEALLGIRMPRRPLFYRKNMGWWQRFKQLAADKHTWLSLVYMILQLPLGIIYFTVLVTLTAVSLCFIAIPILQLGFDVPVSYINGVSYYLAAWMLPLTVIAGILLATLTMHLARYLGHRHGALAKALLVKF